MLKAIGKATPLMVESILKKTLSLSACSPKSFVIKDHFDFDKKVINCRKKKTVTKVLLESCYEINHPSKISSHRSSTQIYRLW